MTQLQSAKIVRVNCSCGRATGLLQYHVETALRQMEDQTLETTGERVAAVLAQMGILRMCCRATYLVAPKYWFVSSDVNNCVVQRIRDTSSEAPPINPGATHLPFPDLPF